jgi:hypothetical protein
LSIRKFHFGRSATRSIARIRCYDPDQCILCGRCVELVRTLRSTKRSPSIGKMRILACSGMADQPSESRAAFRAATASPCVLAMR